MKILLMIMHIFGLQHYIIIMQTKKHRRLDFAMPLANFMGWMVLMITEVAKVNEITPLALVSELKKYIKDETRKENQDADTTRREQESISDPIDDNSDSNDGKHPAEFGK